VGQESATSVVESWNSLQLRYAPKRKYFNRLGLTRQTQLAVLHWNTVQKAERAVVATYKSKSKPRGGEERTITRMELVDHPWKMELVKRAIERKRLLGHGRPVHPADEAEPEEPQGEPTTEQLGEELEDLEDDEML
jgi:hypothetical protein